MLYVYDSLVAKYQTTFERYGIIYTYEKKLVKGDTEYNCFTSEDGVKLIVVDSFYKQYNELEEILDGFSEEMTSKEAIRNIKREITRKTKAVREDDGSGPEEWTIGLVYKDIGVEFKYVDNKLFLEKEFKILYNNIFEKDKIVYLGEDV